MQYDFYSEENAPKRRGLLAPSLNKLLSQQELQYIEGLILSVRLSLAAFRMWR